jgi:TPR repeat protein
VAQAYQEELGVDEDPIAALEWLTKAARSGFAPAQAALGLKYANGEDVVQSYTKAVFLWERAAKQGDAESQHNLGYAYNNGLGVERDVGKAEHWYRQAAEQGVAEAQCILGLMCARGEAGEIDYVEAHQWFSISASAGNQAAAANLKYAETLMSSDQISAASQRAIEWMESFKNR